MATDEQKTEVTVPVVVPEPADGGGLAPVNMGMLQATTPAEMMAVAASIATPLKDFIQKKGLFIFLGGDTPHVYVEGWTTMLAMLGVMPQEISVEEIHIPLDHYPECRGWGPKYVAKMALVRISDQQVVCSASAECGGPDERDWHWRPKYNWMDHPTIPNKRIKEAAGEVPVSAAQRRSMAITRAVGKASRVGFSWVMTLAGYAPTPVEEFDQNDLDRMKDPAAPSDEPPHSADQGRNPREDMGKRGTYEPGGNNRERQEAPKQQEQAQEYRFMRSLFGFVCEVCGKNGKAGEPIAYSPGGGDGPYVAHADCHNAKHGG